MPNLELKVSTIKGEDRTRVNVLRASGFIDSSTFYQLEQALDALRDDPAELILDFSEVEYINSSGIALIIQARDTYANTSRELVLAKLLPGVAKIMSMLGIYDAGVRVFQSVEDASSYLLSGSYGQRNYTPFISRTPLPFPESPVPSDVNVLMVVPEENRFVQVVKHRLQKPARHFEVISRCDEALDRFESLSPDVIILEDEMEGSDDFVKEVKQQPKRSVVPLIRLYWRGTDLSKRRSFKIWEDDHLVEPFELQELFAMAESELRRFVVNRERLFHQTHFEFSGGHREEAEELLTHLLKNCGLSDEKYESFRAAVLEAIDNAIRHGHLGEPDRVVDMVVRVDGNILSVTVEDEGNGFDYTRYLANLGQGLPPPKGRGGLGIYLMYKACDKLEYEAGGKRVKLQLKLNSTPQQV